MTTRAQTRIDRLTGLRLALTVTVAMPMRSLWELVADVTRIGLWSPECIDATWLDPSRAGQVGARFSARNRFAGGITRNTTGRLTHVEPPTVFGWTVLDDTGAVGSRWRYELEPGARSDETVVRHRFEHGPGMTGLRELARQDESAIPERLAQLARNMSGTLLAMERYASAEAA